MEIYAWGKRIENLNYFSTKINKVKRNHIRFVISSRFFVQQLIRVISLMRKQNKNQDFKQVSRTINSRTGSTYENNKFHTVRRWSLAMMSMRCLRFQLKPFSNSTMIWVNYRLDISLLPAMLLISIHYKTLICGCVGRWAMERSTTCCWRLHFLRNPRTKSLIKISRRFVCAATFQAHRCFVWWSRTASISFNMRLASRRLLCRNKLKLKWHQTVSTHDTHR